MLGAETCLWLDITLLKSVKWGKLHKALSKYLSILIIAQNFLLKSYFWLIGGI